VAAGIVRFRDPGPEGVAARKAAQAALDLKQTEFNAQGVEMNQRYESSAVIPDEGTKPEEWRRDRDLYNQRTTRPGTKIPHAWLVGSDGTRMSTLDVTGKGLFTVVTGLAGTAWKDAVRRLDLPFLRIVVTGSPRARPRDRRGRRAACATGRSGGLARQGRDARPQGCRGKAERGDPRRSRPAEPLRAPAREAARTIEAQRRAAVRLTTSQRDTVMSDTRPANFSSVWADLRGVSFKQHYIDAGGIRTRCIESGDPSKPLVLAPHGVGGHAEAYSRNFGPHADHFWFVAIDMLGHGWTDKPAIDYQVKDYADHVLAVLKTPGREKAMISGESLGGWVATYLAVHRPVAVEKLVLNTAGGWTAHPQVMERLKSLSLKRRRTLPGNASRRASNS
jgi:hypothetical protein